MAYPNRHGSPKSGVLPDWLGPLNVEAERGDSLVPPNDMGGVAPSMTKGQSVPDPNAYVSPIEKGGRK